MINPFSTWNMLLFAGCFLFGCYLRHWINTGAGQFRRLGEFIK